MKKLTLILDQTNWLEATWVEEITTQVPVEKETDVDGEIVKETILEDKVETTQIHCESFSGHPEHIVMLRAKALEFEIDLTDFEDLIADCESKFEMPSEESIQVEITKNLIAEAKNYLASTDYKMTVDYFATLTEIEQNELILKRAEAREFIRANKGDE